jgi:hypothetical protein
MMNYLVVNVKEDTEEEMALRKRIRFEKRR